MAVELESLLTVLESTAVDPSTLRTLSALHQDQARILRSQLSLLVGVVEPVRVELADVQQLPFASLPLGGRDVVRVVVAVRRLDTEALILVPDGLLRSIADLLQGGDGCVPPGLELTDIDVHLGRRLVDHLVSSWRLSWQSVVEIDPEVPGRIGVSSLAADIARPEDPVVQIRLSIRGDGWPAPAHAWAAVCLPVDALQKHQERFGGFGAYPPRQRLVHALKRGTLASGLIDRTPIPLHFRLECQAMPVGSLVQVRAGDELPLSGPVDEAICVAGHEPVYRCKIRTDTGAAGRTSLVATSFVRLVPQRGWRFLNQPQPGPETDMEARIPVELTVVLGTARRTVQELRDLADDSVIELDREVDDPVLVLANGVPLFEGRLGVGVNRRYVVHVLRAIQSNGGSTGSGDDK